jgi:capsular exopolysaccharide synthesis family protein
MNDLQRILSTHKYVLLITMLIGAVGAFLYTSVVTPTYRAAASLEFQDITSLEDLVGASAGTLETPAELAAGSAGTVTSNPVLAQARAALGSHKTLQQLRNTVSASVDTASNLVLVTASDHNAQSAASIANAVATATAAASNRSTRLIFAADAVQLQQQIKSIPYKAVNLVTIQNEQVELSHLRTLSVVARPAQIIQSADAPSSPSSPKPLFDTILGAVLGLIVGGAIMFGREALDQTVRTPEQIEDLLEWPTLVELEDSVLGTVPYIDQQHRAELRPLPSTFGVLRRGLELLTGEQAPRIVAVTSAGPEEGKTTVAISLAAAFASVGHRTLLLECDLRRPALASRLGLSDGPGLGAYLLGEAELDTVVHELAVPSRTAHSSNGSGSEPLLECMPAGAPMSDPDELLSSNRFKEMLRDQASKYDIVIVDTAPLLPVPDTLEILPLVDARVICVRAHRARMTDLKALKSMLERLPDVATGCVSTGWSRLERKLGAGYYGRYYGYEAALGPRSRLRRALDR